MFSSSIFPQKMHCHYKYKQPKSIRMAIYLLALLWTFICGTIVPLVADKKSHLSISEQHLYFQQYAYAKQIYKEGRYAEAKSLFDKLREREWEPSFAPYIHFYYALAAYHNGEQVLAAQTFYWINLHFPLWSKQNEIRYWSAQCKFQEGNFAEALALLALIQDKGMAKSVLQMKKYFLAKIENCVCLQELVAQFPNEDMLKKILYKKAVRQAYITQDFSLVNQLKEQYNGCDYAYEPLRHLQSKRKEAYRVAVFFPFFVEELDYEACTNQFVIDLYQGIQCAIEDLVKEGIKIHLFAFDTKKNAKTTEVLLAQEELKYMDLIIGPLYPATIPLVAAFAKKHKINFVNPISGNPDIMHDNPFAFLFQPSVETCAQKAAQLTLSDIHDQSIVEPVIAVFYGSAREDVLQAALYKRMVEQKLGRELDWFVQLSNNEEVKNFVDQIAKLDQAKTIGQEEEVEVLTHKADKLDFKQITHLYVPSQDGFLVSNVISLPFRLHIRPQIIGHEQWLKKEILTFSQLEKLPILFLSPCYIDFHRPALMAFREKFFEQTATQPNEQSYVGYEMMLFFGRILATYGIYFQKEWEKMHYSGVIFPKLYYGKHHANQHIPVLRFVKNKFVVVQDPLEAG
ncbi:tetratricopeptide repeat protein [Candidatus Cardinium hertigii]|uniref:Leucine-binding protein domain-containing protein n=1 Tax=Candidatus Cardinium hertigii TaxID=247481 RepID=A0A3N2QC73_9BACT|nr:tetratricopeptide repeat protein [Candidatus Cardinium hertigii]ROT47386.1 hypothetical protein EDM02_03045 [Candidatus Cardinium hertigii]